MYGGAYLQRDNCVSKSVGLALQLEVNVPCQLCFTLYLRAIFQVQSPGDLYLKGRFNRRFFALPVWASHIWRGLYMEGLIFRILRYFDAANLISGNFSRYGLLPRFIYISPGRVQKCYFEPFFSIHVIHIITNLGIGQDLFMKQLRTKPDLATHRLQYVTYVNIGSGTQKEVRFIPLGEGGRRLRNKALF